MSTWYAIAVLAACGAVFAATVPAVGWLMARRLPLDSAEKLVAATGLSLLAVFAFGWLGYVAAWPHEWWWLLPALGIATLIRDRRALALLWTDPAVRRMIVGQILATAWCLGWLAFVSTYSGGAWAGDWFEHWERAQFFLKREPLDTLFLGYASLTARPPLANIVMAVFLGLTRVDFVAYQILSTMWATLAFLPTALLARRFGGDRAIGWCLVLVLVNPLFVQNATFPWTKLPAAFFALAALYFFVTAIRHEQPATRAVLMAAMLAGGLLAHYSTGPYAVLLAAGWVIVSCTRRDAPWWRASAAAAATGAAVLAMWFAWSLHHFGVRGTALTNTSVQAADATALGQLGRGLLNLRDTVVPHFLRHFDRSLVAQHSPWGAVRDWWFQLYQLNLLFAVGAVSWLALLVIAVRRWPRADRTARRGWVVLGAGAVVLGVGVHGARDYWGLTHICLQPVVLLALAGLAAHWRELSRWWRVALALGLALDFTCGILLHYAVEHLAFERWIGPEAFAHWQENASYGAILNMTGKLRHHLRFFGDAPTLAPLASVALVAVLFVVRGWLRREAMAARTAAMSGPAVLPTERIH